MLDGKKEGATFYGLGLLAVIRMLVSYKDSEIRTFPTDG